MSSDDSDSSSDFESQESSSEDENVRKETLYIYEVLYSFYNNQIPVTLIANEQWIKSIEFCSIKSESNESEAAGLNAERLCKATDVNFGEKDVTEYGWILTNNNQPESLIVSFETPVFINEIHIYESLNPGSVVKLEMLEPQRSKDIKMNDEDIYTVSCQIESLKAANA